MRNVIYLLLAGSILYNQSLCASSDIKNETNQLVAFLTSQQLLIQSKDGELVPLSYYIGGKHDVANYFGDFVCMTDNTCSVTDSLYSDPFAILGRGLPPQLGSDDDKARAQAQLERTDMRYGADIYDAATWQIALAAAAHHGYLDKSTAEKLIGNQTKRLLNNHNRATNQSFKYGYKTTISDPRKAFAFRMIATDFINKDPFYQGPYQDFVTWDYEPEEMAKNDPDGHRSVFAPVRSVYLCWSHGLL